MNWMAIAERSLEGRAPAREECRAALLAPTEEVPQVVAAAARIRFACFGRRIKLNYLVNIKSGLCPEDCGYCSQSRVSSAPIDKYTLLNSSEILEGARRARSLGASRLCLVASGRGPGEEELSHLCAAVRHLKAADPPLEVCACLGLLRGGQAEALKAAGVSIYNHNLNTSESFYDSVCSTHAYADRQETLGKARQSGLSACAGGIAGMGETDEDLIDLAFALRGLSAESIPVNFLTPISGTPLEGVWKLTPERCLKILCLFRFVNPRSELRIAGGREVHLGSLQALGLWVANSIFIGDYLTTTGQPPQEDWRLIRDLGFEIEGGFRPPEGNLPPSERPAGELLSGRRA